MLELELLKVAWAITCGRIREIRTRDDGEGGYSVVEVAVWIGIFVAAAIIIGGILVAKARNKANSIQTQ